MRYLLGVDVGTSSLKAVLFDEAANPVRTVTKDYTLKVSGSFVEFPAEQYWVLFSEALAEMTADCQITAMSIDTQCETLIVADAAGNALTDAIVWLDNRAVSQAERIKRNFGEQRVYEITGQPEITAAPSSSLRISASAEGFSNTCAACAAAASTADGQRAWHCAAPPAWS